MMSHQASVHAADNCRGCVQEQYLSSKVLAARGINAEPETHAHFAIRCACGKFSMRRNAATSKQSLLPQHIAGSSIPYLIDKLSIDI